MTKMVGQPLLLTISQADEL